MSVTDAGGKRREIVVPGRAKPKDKEKTKKEKPQGAISLRGTKTISVSSPWQTYFLGRYNKVHFES